LTALSDHAPWTVVLGVDTPRAADAVPRLVAAVADVVVADTEAAGGGGASVVESGGAGVTQGGGVDGAWFVDGEGEPQPLLAIYRTRPLLDRTRDLEDGTSMRRLVAGLTMVTVPDADGVTRDLDTWADAQYWKERLG